MKVYYQFTKYDKHPYLLKKWLEIYFIENVCTYTEVATVFSVSCGAISYCVQKAELKEKRIQALRARFGGLSHTQRHRLRYPDYDKNYRSKILNGRNQERRKTDPMFRLNNNISNGIWYSLKGNKNGRRWETLVGYTLSDLKTHLEKQFTSKMTWNNYTLYWEVDHINPKYTFNFVSPEDKNFKQCWALRNLRPLEVSENRKRPKKTKIT